MEYFVSSSCSTFKNSIKKAFSSFKEEMEYHFSSSGKAVTVVPPLMQQVLQLPHHQPH